jgi:hypothetical protein
MKTLLFAGLVALTAPTTLLAHETTRDFKLVNDSRWNITDVYFSTADSNTWSPLRNGFVAGDGGVANVQFDNAGECNVQLKVRLENGEFKEWLNGFNLCAVSKIDIYYNGDEDNFDASSE